MTRQCHNDLDISLHPEGGKSRGKRNKRIKLDVYYRFIQPNIKLTIARG
jgi:hypothetical protein